MKKGIWAVGAVLIAAAAAGGIYWFVIRSDSNKISDGEKAFVSSVSTVTGYSSGNSNRYAGVVEPQETVEVKIESGRKVTEAKVQVGDEVKEGQLLFEYDLSSIQQDLQEQKLALDRLKNEALSLQEQISTLEKEKTKASQDNQLSYTIEIETNKMNLKKNEYDQKSKEAQITQLEEATQNTEVRSEIDGVVQKIDTSKLTSEDGDSLNDNSGFDSLVNSDGSSSDAFITILSTGAYRVKGQINEQNMQSISEGLPIIIRSRVDETQVWRGIISVIDRDNAISSQNSYAMYGMMDSSSSQTTSSSYPFYVELDSSDGLMLGQHVYIELDIGQEDKRDGLWLSEFMIVDADSTDPYVWAADDNGKLEKRDIILGNYDEDMGEYEIVDGLALTDHIAYPSENLHEGMATTESDQSFNMGTQIDTSGTDTSSAEQLGADDNIVTDMEGETVGSSGQSSDAVLDEELVPMEADPGSEAVAEEVQGTE